MKSSLIAIALVLLGTVASHASTIVQNGSFEDGAPVTSIRGQSFESLAARGGRNWDIFSELNGWQTVSGPGIEVQTNRTLRSINALDGQHYLELDSTRNSTIGQSVDLSAGRYALSFWYAPRTGSVDSNGIDFSVGSPSATLLSDGVRGPLGAFRVGTWTEVVREFTVTETGAYDLRFAATGRSDSLGGLIDDVSISPVPLPLPGALLLAGLGGLVAMRRRKGAQA